MKKYQHIASLFLRLAIAAGFLSAVADRFGYWGINDSKGVAWGDWQHFVNYTNVLLPFASPSVANVFAIAATIAKAGLAFLLIPGLYTKLAALCTGMLGLVFGVSMMLTLGIKAPLDYSVFVLSAAGFLLAGVGEHGWSLDAIILQRNGNSSSFNAGVQRNQS
ncbi:hypothetical protein BH11BAC3_BH11BAC3_01840 [soil metagenome]